MANTYLEGTYSELYPDLPGREGCSGCSDSSPSQVAFPASARPRRPVRSTRAANSGYSLAHAYGAAFDNPDLVVACVIGDGEAETGPLAASWHANKFMNPAHDGAVLPILHLNGCKIANPTIPARIGRDELEALLPASGTRSGDCRGRRPADVHQTMAAAMDAALDRIREIQAGVRERTVYGAPAVADDRARTPKGWTGPKMIDGVAVRGHLSVAPGAADRRPDNADHLQAAGGMDAELPAGRALRRATARRCRRCTALAPAGDRRMGANPHANGGRLLRALRPAGLPATCGGGVGARRDSGTRRRGSRAQYLRDVMTANEHARTSASSAPTRPRRTGWTRALRGHRQGMAGQNRARRRSSVAGRAG